VKGLDAKSKMKTEEDALKVYEMILKDLKDFLEILKDSPLFTDEEIKFSCKIFNPLREFINDQKWVKGELDSIAWIFKNCSINEGVKLRLLEREKRYSEYLKKIAVAINQIQKKWRNKILIIS
jgi:hypothetical protein